MAFSDVVALEAAALEHFQASLLEMSHSQYAQQSAMMYSSQQVGAELSPSSMTSATMAATCPILASTLASRSQESALSALGLMVQAMGQKEKRRLRSKQAISDYSEEDASTVMDGRLSSASSVVLADGSLMHDGNTSGSEQESYQCWMGYPASSLADVEYATWNQDYNQEYNQKYMFGMNQTSWRPDHQQPVAASLSGWNQLSSAAGNEKYESSWQCVARTMESTTDSILSSVPVAQEYESGAATSQARAFAMPEPQKILDPICGKGMKTRRLPKGEPVKKQPLEL
eukprot:TRINITY_DN37654_c0_g1_i1.p1 TRINITY_DN37654_c0_g1~~TRINITY_DN37654_c0_g1_i1.p1  ORF type:complete len:286 (+),score=76.32 TRINITY_DN37654_c0_g1_i1:143-1000(+)